MENRVNLLYKSYKTFFHTFLPVYFYGMPNGKVYCMYNRFYDAQSTTAEMEFVFAEHEDYFYDYNSGEIFTGDRQNIDLTDFKVRMDEKEQQVKTLKVFGGFKSYPEAQLFMEKQGREMVASIQMEVC